jgi:hypothetical protein
LTAVELELVPPAAITAWAIRPPDEVEEAIRGRRRAGDEGAGS